MIYRQDGLQGYIRIYPRRHTLGRDMEIEEEEVEVAVAEVMVLENFNLDAHLVGDQPSTAIIATTTTMRATMINLEDLRTPPNMAPITHPRTIPHLQAIIRCRLSRLHSK